ncbi:Various environmental stresses-induced protein [Variovorax sp. SRS16]|uniref:HutD/Ves family protein n=1 Tax=Variovorax sp. SRS16 TaxID=282217 RepID=UPI0013189F68|nr:HutD family protein [Variovorax sp. SRS16]VTU12941.1 Various environmental stresses-induced protein [Variovorax sp. SRS16]
MKTLRHFSRDALPVTPWKNGGGTTQEIACGPPGTTLGDFGWRVSIATIAAAGPFSVFAGTDRSIMLLEGDGVRLRSRDGRIDHRLEALHRPFAFPGDTAIDCALLGGASSDFNVMTRRGQWRAEVQVVDRAASIAAAPHGVLLALRGRWTLNTDAPACREGEGLCWSGEPMAWRAVPVGAHARLAVVRIVPVSSAENEEGSP